MTRVVVLPDEAALDSPKVAARFPGLDRLPIEAFRAGRPFKAEAYLLHGLWDARGQVLAHLLRRAGRRVALDGQGVPPGALAAWQGVAPITSDPLAPIAEKPMAAPPVPAGPICVLHGMGSGSAVHKQVQRLGALSVGTPLCAAKLAFDIRYHGARDLQVDLSEAARGGLRPDLAISDLETGSKPRFRVDLGALPVPRPVPADPQPAPPLRIIDLARRAPVLAEARAVLARLYAAPLVILSDGDLPACP